jgi:hypothetical protein
MKTHCKNNNCKSETSATFIITSGASKVQSHLAGVCRSCADTEKERLKSQRFFNIRIRHEDAVFPTWPSKMESEDPNSEWWRSVLSEPALATA